MGIWFHMFYMVVYLGHNRETAQTLEWSAAFPQTSQRLQTVTRRENTLHNTDTKVVQKRNIQCQGIYIPAMSPSIFIT